MTRRTFNDISFDVPDDWVDTSIVTLLAPSPKPVQMLRAKTSDSERPSVTMTRADVRGVAYELEDYALAQEKILRELLDDLEVTDRGAAKAGGVDVVTREVKFKDPEGQVMRQSHAYFRMGDTMHTLTATGTHDLSFEPVKKQLEAMLASLESV
jgi:hypothetical protein